MPRKSRKPFGLGLENNEDGSYTIKKEGLLSSKSITLGTGGVSMESKTLLSSSSASIGAKGVAVEKNGLLSSSSASVGAEGVAVEKDGLLSSSSASVSTSGVEIKKVVATSTLLGTETRRIGLGSLSIAKHYLAPGEDIIGQKINIEKVGMATVLSFNKVGFPAKIFKVASTHTVRVDQSGTEQELNLKRYKKGKKWIAGADWSVVDE